MRHWPSSLKVYKLSKWWVDSLVDVDQAQLMDSAETEPLMVHFWSVITQHIGLDTIDFDRCSYVSQMCLK